MDQGNSRADLGRTRFKHSGNVASRQIAGELLLVPIKTKAGKKTGIYTLNPTAAKLWNLMDGKNTVADMVRTVASEFDVREDVVMNDTRVFIEDLLTFDAITRTEDR